MESIEFRNNHGQRGRENGSCLSGEGGGRMLAGGIGQRFEKEAETGQKSKTAGLTPSARECGQKKAGGNDDEANGIGRSGAAFGGSGFGGAGCGSGGAGG